MVKKMIKKILTLDESFGYFPGGARVVERLNRLEIGAELQVR
jgi:hypothetical protein